MLCVVLCVKYKPLVIYKYMDNINMNIITERAREGGGEITATIEALRDDLRTWAGYLYLMTVYLSLCPVYCGRPSSLLIADRCCASISTDTLSAELNL